MASSTPLFDPGTICGTPAALQLLANHRIVPLTLVARHVCGDYGDTCKADAKANTQALKDGSRIFSVYKITAAETVWVITEAVNDESGLRESTCILLPSEY